ncbi:hypothetical protein [Teredinibacter purpureus]|uniref:hypothetical protein n=1 Tax=Teredinibacter purpureus TaxID=2731756 RepID=UPI0005F79AE4|nr:hypothetical protein [Teredinibacter purpureus]
MSSSVALDLDKGPQNPSKESQNKKIYWDISDFKKQNLAISFARDLNDRLCVYSSGLQHVYGQYSIEMVVHRKKKLVVVPNTYSTERYVDIDEDSIRPTGVHIYPGWYFSIDKPYVMTMPIKTRQGVTRTRPLSPEHGFNILERTFYKRPFYPILKNGDLREFDQETPYLHLHRIAPESMKALSSFDIDQLCGLIIEKRNRLMFQ